MSRRLAVFFVLLACLTSAFLPAIGQQTGGSHPSRPSTSSAPADSNGDEGAQQNQPQQIIVTQPAAAPTSWGWREQLTWGSTIVLAVLGYIGIMLALRMLKNIDQHLQAGTASSGAALALAQAIANSERPWIVVTVEPFLTMENSFKVMASNRGRSPARIVSSVDAVRVALDEASLPKVPELEEIAPGDEPEPIVLLPGEATGIWALNREDLPTICKDPEELRKVQRWQENLFLFGRIRYIELASIGEPKLHETFWCCRYIHGEKSSTLVMAGAPAYNKHT